MTPTTNDRLSRTKRMLIAGLLALAAVLLMVGNAVERNREQLGATTEVSRQETGQLLEGNSSV